jgi:hypothetical protein
MIRHILPLSALTLLLLHGCSSSPAPGSEGSSDAAVDAATDATLDVVSDVDATADTREDAQDTAIDTDGSSSDGSADTDADDGPVLCATNDDCAGDPCVPLSDDGSVGICSDFCELSSDCPAGFTCTLVRSSGADSVRVCLPTDFCLDQDSDGYGVGAACTGPDCDDSDETVNPGRRERCDGRDDSCSGAIDDDPQFGSVGGADVRIGDACETGFQGICAAGAWACQDGGTVCVQGAFPSTEVCNGLDDDCDGTVDLNGDGSSLQRDFYRGPEGTRDVGLCEGGIEQCQSGEWTVTTEQVVPTVERCDDLDWDCSGQTLDVPAELLQSSQDNCGSCGNACTTGFVCNGGACVCPADRELCDGVCRDTLTDNSHCGECGTVCTGSRVCSAGSCECPFGGIFCDGLCRDPQTNGQHCGACGNVCSGGQACEAGICACPAGSLFCDGQCRDPLTNANHCGACGNVCEGGQACIGGNCGCPSGGILCDGQCRDPLTNASHCGACGVVCSGGQTCNDGTCQCPTGQTLCDGVCRNLQTDSNNCGDCGIECPGALTCRTGTCACAPGSFQCGTACVTSEPGTACYTGTSGAPGVGICEAGTWTCSGNSVTCVGQVGPRTRVCNGVDDDCNNISDQGCPTSLSLGTSTTTDAGDSDGSFITTSQTWCPAGSVITGFRVRIRNCDFFTCGIFSGDRVYGWQPVCSPISLGNRTSDNVYAVNLGAPSALPISTGDSYNAGNWVTQACPTGRAVNAVFYDSGEGGHLSALKFTCVRPRITGTPGSMSTALDSAAEMVMWRGTNANNSITCASNGLLTGFTTKWNNSHAHALRARCAPLSVTLQP